MPHMRLGSADVSSRRCSLFWPCSPRTSGMSHRETALIVIMSESSPHCAPAAPVSGQHVPTVHTMGCKSARFGVGASLILGHLYIACDNLFHA